MGYAGEKSLTAIVLRESNVLLEDQTMREYCRPSLLHEVRRIEWSAILDSFVTKSIHFIEKKEELEKRKRFCCVDVKD